MGVQMRKLTIILILMYCFLGIISNIANLIQLPFDNLSITSEFLKLNLRFGDLIFLMGILGVFLISKNDTSIRVYSLSYVVLGVIKFLAIDFGLVDDFGPLFMIFLMLMTVVLMGLVLQFNEYSIEALALKGNVLIAVLGLYGIVYAFLLIFSILEGETVLLSISVLTSIMHIGLKICIGIFFIEVYKEMFVSDDKGFLN